MQALKKYEGNFGKILTERKKHEEMKKYEDSVRTGKFVKCPMKFQKILKILRDFGNLCQNLKRIL